MSGCLSHYRAFEDQILQIYNLVGDQEFTASDLPMPTYMKGSLLKRLHFRGFVKRVRKEPKLVVWQLSSQTVKKVRDGVRT